MHELFSFFIRWSKWFVFVFFVALSCALLFSGNPYQHHVYLTSANSVASGIYNMRNSVASYFDLREINEDLNLRNAALESEVLALREQIREADARIQTDTMRLPGVLAQYNFVVAHVISNSIARPHNYITINKGTADGIAPEMGVIDHNGVVGIVNVAGPHSARIISLLNPHFKLSCKIKVRSRRHYRHLGLLGCVSRRHPRGLCHGRPAAPRRELFHPARETEH